MFRELQKILDIIFYTIIICLVPIFTVIGLLSILALMGHYRQTNDPYERKACLWTMIQWNALSFLLISFLTGLFFGEGAIDWYNHYFPHPGWLVQWPLWILHVDFMDPVAGPTLLDWAVCILVFLMTSYWKPFGEIKYVGDEYKYFPPDGYDSAEVIAACKAQQEFDIVDDRKRINTTRKTVATHTRKAVAEKKL